MDAKDWDQDDHRPRRLHHCVRMVPVEVVLKLQFQPAFLHFCIFAFLHAVASPLIWVTFLLCFPTTITFVFPKLASLSSVDKANFKVKFNLPYDFDHVEDEEYVDEDGKDGGDGQEINTVALVHPAELILVCQPLCFQI